MAQSRLEKIGTIYTRVKGLLEAGAMKPVDRPIWYDVYKAFPPRLEPRFDRSAPNITLREILYAEDTVRAEFHKSYKRLQTTNLIDDKQETQTQQFIKIYDKLKSQGALDKEQIFKTALELLAEKSPTTKYKTTYDTVQRKKPNITANLDAAKEHNELNLTAANEAIVEESTVPHSELKQKDNKENKSTEPINISKLFQD